MHKRWVLNRMVNYIWLACMLKTYRTWNSTVGFLKYEFNSKLYRLVQVTLGKFIKIHI